jgi:hypothetical protein
MNEIDARSTVHGTVNIEFAKQDNVVEAAWSLGRKIIGKCLDARARPEAAPEQRCDACQPEQRRTVCVT